MGNNQTMKKFLTGLFCLLSMVSFGQQKPTDIDKSPMDMAYAPRNFPILKMNGEVTGQPLARVIYSRPQKMNRDIFGGIVAYHEVWRLGANESTEIEFFKNVKINGKTVAKGRYTMYAICTENTWTIILNREKDTWGLAYNPKKDVVHVDVPVQYNSNSVEVFTMFFEDIRDGTNLNVLWDTVKVSLPINF